LVEGTGTCEIRRISGTEERNKKEKKKRTLWKIGKRKFVL